MKQPKVCVLLASGMEEMEAIILIDVLRRGNVAVTTLSAEKGAHCHSGLPIHPDHLIQASRGTWHVADRSLESVSNQELLEYDMILLPGGLKGADTWNSHPRISEILKAFQKEKKWIGAICAAPKILLQHGILSAEDRYTAYPGATHETQSYTGEDVEILEEKKIITSKGPGTAFSMALDILRILQSKEIEAQVRKGLLLPD